jgi:uncharacterized protein YdiU (UPF0061 family)
MLHENKNEIACFDNSYTRLPERFYERVQPTAVLAPKLARLNEALVKELRLDLKTRSQEELAALFSGNILASGSEPIAQAYAGHQFGHFVPQLGDGRAILLGEVLDQAGKRRDIQLKGSGRTRFSRNGDGRAALGPVIREYILSEAMFHLGIPTTRSLAIVTTGEEVFRERPLPGAVLTRIAASHIRVGTFQYFLARGDTEAIKLLADYVIERHYPEAKTAQQPYEALLRAVADAQASLVAKWMQVGFIHGVMNTDNTAISGETIDYGPCAFMDEYDPDTVFSSIDQRGRYAYGNQGNIAEWNLMRFAECLLGLLDEHEERAIDKAKEALATFLPAFERTWGEGMCRKIGLTENEPDALLLIQDLLALMKEAQADYTLSFRYLSLGISQDAEAVPLKSLFSNSVEFDAWCARWRKQLQKEKKSASEIAQAMNRVNPAFIPRNHRVEQALQAAVTRHDFSKADQLIEVLSKPYDDQPANSAYMAPPKPDERVHETFCGT